MSWCDPCQRQLDPSELTDSGACPTCDTPVAGPPQSKIPWHFWVLVTAAGAYLGWRGIEGVLWVFDRLL